jgi:uncharacterized membrane-anchored protein YitT (DUF2179 family)
MLNVVFSGMYTSLLAGISRCIHNDFTFLIHFTFIFLGSNVQLRALSIDRVKPC